MMCKYEFNNQMYVMNFNERELMNIGNVPYCKRRMLRKGQCLHLRVLDKHKEGCCPAINREDGCADRAYLFICSVLNEGSELFFGHGRGTEIAAL